MSEFDALRDFEFQRSENTPLQLQLYQGLKERILSGRLTADTKLPSSRGLASDLSVSRNTVNSALEQLKAEGYIKTKPGAGHYISDELPEDYLHAKLNPKVAFKTNNPGSLSLSARGQKLMGKTKPRIYNNQSFEAGLPDLKAFPLQKWSQIQHRHSQRTSLLGYDDLQGHAPLRRVLAEYLRTSRGVVCSPEQIIITVGAQQAVNIAIQVLLEKGDLAYLENPGYIGMRLAFEHQWIKTTGIDVNEQGIDIEQLPEKPRGKLICLTPTHQYPMGGIIPLANRLKILQWAADNNIWVIEDDYDSEYHFDHKPIAAMQGLGLAEQVIYIGSFSKVLYPGLRLGYMVVPKQLTNACIKAKNLMTGQTALVEQATVAEFIEAGHFVRHLGKMRLLYHEKLKAILLACQQHLVDYAEPIYSGAGMHIVLILKPPTIKQAISDIHIVERLKEKSIYCSALSSYYIGTAKKQGLVLGFANTAVDEMDQKIAIIKQVLTRTH